MVRAKFSPKGKGGVEDVYDCNSVPEGPERVRVALLFDAVSSKHRLTEKHHHWSTPVTW